MKASSALRDFLALSEGDSKPVQQLLLSTMFDRQRAFWRDPRRRKALLCGRRAGKTDLVCKMLLLSSEEHPGEDEWTGYATLTQGVSLRNIEGTLKKLIRQFGLSYSRHEVKNQVHYRNANGHTIWIGGIDDARKAERYRGNKWRLFVIDEAGTFPPAILKYIVVDVLNAALSDHDGQIVVSGSPGQLEQGYWWEITTGLGENYGAWPTWHWTCADNPHHRAFRDPVAFFDSERTKEGWERPANDNAEAVQASRDAWDASNATFRREWFGVWAVDKEALIYAYDLDRNGFMRLPERTGEWKFILGIDCGHRDATTFTLTASCYGWPDVWVMESWGKPGMLPADVATSIHQIQQRLASQQHELNRIVVDPAGGGAGLTALLVATYGIQAYAADKRGKAAGIRLVQDGLRRGTLHVHPYHCAQLLGEWAVLGWNKKRDDHNPAQEDDCSDGCIYSVKEHHIVEVHEIEPPLPGTKEALLVEANDYEERLRFEQSIRSNSDLSPLQKRRMLRRR